MHPLDKPLVQFGLAALTVAAAGVPVVKHGNRAASSLCGTADLLEHFGIPLDLGPAGVARTVAEAGMGFCFAARFHPGMRHAGGARGVDPVHVVVVSRS